MSDLNSRKFINNNNFNEFTFSKNWHFDLFKLNNYDEELFSKVVNSSYCDLKNYQDLLVYSFIKQNVKPGSKILDVGGGDSRILRHFKYDYECWNIDKLEGIGHGPRQIDSSGFRLVQDYIGNFNDELPDNYFDLVFSISTLEHIPLDNYEIYGNILSDINRVLKPESFSIHCIDHTTDLLLGIETNVWTNPIIPFFFENQKMINDYIPLEIAERDPELFFMSEKYYKENWELATGKKFEEFGKPFSYNLLWKKM
ncbi:MAG: class I SAM-dependent methyltransferase [Ignavibacteria bacterium]